MSVTPIWFSGFETNSTAVWSTVSTTGTVSVVTTTVNTDTYAMCHESAAYVEYDLDTNVSEIYMSIQVEPEDVYSGGGAGAFFDIEFHLTDANIIKLRLLQTDLYWDAYVDGSKVADGTTAATDDWHNIQIYLKIDDTVGQIQTKIEGSVDIIYEGDTKIDTGELIDKIRISTDTDGASKYCYYDDVFLCTGGWPGQIYIQRMDIETELEE
jgi:hypothetical protein